MSSMTYKDKKCETGHHVIGMADSKPQKNRRSVKWKTLGDDETYWPFITWIWNMNEAYSLLNLLEFAFLFDRLYAYKFANSTYKFYTLFVPFFIPYLHAI